MHIASMMGKRLSLALVVALPAVLVLLWFQVFTSPESREFANGLREWHGWIEPAKAKGKGPSVECAFTIQKAEGIPGILEGRSAGISYQWPDQFFLTTEIDEEKYFIARAGPEAFIHVPHKGLAVRGSNDVPRFSTRPDSVEPVSLPPFSLPVSRVYLGWLPALIQVEKERGDGSESIFKVRPKGFAAKRLGLPEQMVLTVSVDRETKRPVSIRLQDGKEKDVMVGFSDWRIGSDDLEWKEWEGASPEEKTERVALSHLVRFAKVTLSHLGDRIEPLPPEEGRREVLARSGNGRLEEWDGTRVLFLKGSPEDMGRQHGELMGEEVREVVDRILYGIGVGSSFDKGRWFFGEIEEAVSRVGPFVDPRYIREMDALAMASGLEKEEVRLANFFPELFHCTGFAIHGNATVGGKMYHGRVLDYMRGVGLEQNAVVMVVQPEEGNAWVNVGYASFIGTVTAMNEKHIAIGEMGGRGEGNWDGKPMAQLMREVMEKADTIEEAVAIMEKGPRTCEYYYVISDGKSGKAVGISATPDVFETIWSGETHPKLPDPVEDTVLMSAGDRYKELVRRVEEGYGDFDAESAIELMSRPVCMTSNIQSVLFAPESLDFWVANADSDKVASETRYTKYNLAELLRPEPELTRAD